MSFPSQMAVTSHELILSHYLLSHTLKLTIVSSKIICERILLYDRLILIIA